MRQHNNFVLSFCFSFVINCVGKGIKIENRVNLCIGDYMFDRHRFETAMNNNNTCVNDLYSYKEIVRIEHLKGNAIKVQTVCVRATPRSTDIRY